MQDQEYLKPIRFWRPNRRVLSAQNAVVPLWISQNSHGFGDLWIVLHVVFIQAFLVEIAFDDLIGQQAADLFFLFRQRIFLGGLYALQHRRVFPGKLLVQTFLNGGLQQLGELQLGDGVIVEIPFLKIFLEIHKVGVGEVEILQVLQFVGVIILIGVVEDGVFPHQGVGDAAVFGALH